MARRILQVVLMTVLAVASALAAEEGLVAHWDFDEGSGAVLHDRTANANHGKIIKATWTESGKGHALRFDGAGAYVDCGAGPSLALTGPMSLSAWVYATAISEKEPGIVGKYWEVYALTYYRGGAWWYISGGGNGTSAVVSTGQWHHLVGTFDGTQTRLFLDGEQQSVHKSKFGEVKTGPQHFTIGCIIGDPNAADTAMRNTAFFEGMIDEVKVYSRALSASDVLAEYNRLAADKGREPTDMSWVGRVAMTPYDYPDRNELVMALDCRGVLPLPPEEGVTLQLLRKGDTTPVAAVKVVPTLDAPRTEAVFALKPRNEFALGEYVVRALVAGKAPEEQSVFVVPALPAAIPLPEERTAPPLPAPAPDVAYRFAMKNGGGFTVTVRGVEYPVESAFSFPNAGDNRLVAADAPDRSGEPEWTVSTQQAGDRAYRVIASGKYYTVDRTVSFQDQIITVRDTITNTSSDVIAIPFENAVTTRGRPVKSVEVPRNSTFFIVGEDHGLGLVALDDIYQLQQESFYRDDRAVMGSRNFGLRPKAVYTLEWSLYPRMVPDYFDFINAVRRNEGLTGRTLAGAWGGVDVREPKPVEALKKVIRNKNLKYLCIGPSWRPPEDTTVSLEGIEFYHRYRTMSDVLRKWTTELRREFPDTVVMFHIAHSLYATGEPEKLFPDSLAMDANGNQIIYGPNSLDYYGKYFSKERFDQNYRWWIFYPTLENSFGKAMLEATDYMLDDIGVNGMWGDGFIAGYVKGGYIYNTFDGYSVEADPATRTVKRKMGNVTCLALPVLREVARKIAARGGMLFTNGEPGPRSFWKENYIATCETGGSDQQPVAGLHMGPTVVALGDPTRIKTRHDFYRDILAKLDWGALYFYYGERNFADEPTLITAMYPITVESIHSGWVQGRERIVTKRSGAYAWPGDRCLHQVYRCDARGIPVPNADFTTVTPGEVRTGLDLKPLESAVISRIPVALQSDRAVNALVERYDAESIALLVSGTGKALLTIESGAFAIRPGAKYFVTADPPRSIAADERGVLRFEVPLARRAAIRIRAE